MGYSYPIDTSWTMEELLAVMDLFRIVEKAYEGGVGLSEVNECYRAFKNMGFSMSDEKQLNSAFEKVSGYSMYEVLKACKRGDKFIRLKVGS